MLTLWRERGWWTTVGALFGVMLLGQLLFLASIGVEAMHRLLQTQLDLRLQVQEMATDQDVQEFIVALRELPYVQRVEYVTREQAYARERQRNPELVNFLEEFKIQNPFPDTIAVTLHSLKDYDAFAAFTRQPEWARVADPAFLSQATDQERDVRQLLRLTEAGAALVLGFLGIILFILLFVLMELVRRRALLRREEIVVERLVGAHQLSVLIPFATEAALLLLCAFLLSILVVLSFGAAIPFLVPFIGSEQLAALRGEGAAVAAAWIPAALPAALLAIPLFALAGAYLGMRPQMRKGRIVLGGA
jgi:cell division transport system permease protein